MAQDRPTTVSLSLSDWCIPFIEAMVCMVGREMEGSDELTHITMRYIGVYGTRIPGVPMRNPDLDITIGVLDTDPPYRA